MSSYEIKGPILMIFLINENIGDDKKIGTCEVSAAILTCHLSLTLKVSLKKL